MRRQNKDDDLLNLQPERSNMTLIELEDIENDREDNFKAKLTDLVKILFQYTYPIYDDFSSEINILTSFHYIFYCLKLYLIHKINLIKLIIL